MSLVFRAISHTLFIQQILIDWFLYVWFGGCSREQHRILYAPETYILFEMRLNSKQRHEVRAMG